MTDHSAWFISNRFDRRALPLADRHYNRRKPGSPQFVPPGRCLVLLTESADGLWVTSWPFAEYVRHDWPGAWINSLFRNESPILASDLIRQAVAATVAFYGPAPEPHGLITFVDAAKVHRKREPGRCYKKAGFLRPPCPRCGGYAAKTTCRVCGDGKARTAGGLIVWQLPPDRMPDPAPARTWQTFLFGAAF